MSSKLPGIRRIVRRKVLPSTQSYARKLAENRAPGWTLVRADRQTQGRGRMDRRWSSGAGGLFISLILRPKMSPAQLPRMSFRVGRACAAALAGVSGVETIVKLPNDVLARTGRGKAYRKICGILIEAAGTSSRLDWVVIGIGVNVNNRIPLKLSRRAASLSDLAGRSLSVEAVLRRLVHELRKCDKIA